MGRLLIVCRLAARDLRRRRAQSVLLLLAIAATTTTLTLGLLVRGVAEDPWERTRAATAGPDAVATLPSMKSLDALAKADGVESTAGPFLTVSTQLRSDGVTVNTVVQGRETSQDVAVDRPLVTEGSWVSRGTLVVEQAFAEALGVRPGDRISVAGRSFRVSGIAITSGRVPYPSAAPGLVWTTQDDATRLPSGKRQYTMPIRLADPSSAPAFAAAHPGVRSAQDMGAYATSDLQLSTGALLGGTWALALLAALSVALIVGGRLAEQGRRVGALKAAGATPIVIAAVLLVEHLAIAVLAAAVGLGAGWAIAPALTGPSAGLLGAENGPVPSIGIVAIVTLTAVLVTALATAFPALRGARISTTRALTEQVRGPRPRRFGMRAARRPVPLMLGVRAMVRRPRRTLLAGLSMAVTVAMTVAALAMRQDVARKDAGAVGPDFVPGAANPVTERISQIVLALSLALLLLAAVNAILTAWATSLDSARTAALTRALGATPRQVTSGLAVAQLLPAAAAALGGIPLGLLVHAAARLISGAETAGEVPVSWLVAVVPGTLVAVGLLTAIPIRYGAMRPIATTLAHDR